MLIRREFDLSNLPSNTSYLRGNSFFCIPYWCEVREHMAISFPKHCFDLLASKASNVDLFLKSICFFLSFHCYTLAHQFTLTFSSILSSYFPS